MTDVPAPEVLRRLFGVIQAEAEKNEAFARRLLEALHGDVPPKVEKPRAAPRKAFDPSVLHAINVLRAYGENVLRGKLEQIKATDDLRAIARFSGLVLTGDAARPKAARAQVIDGIVAAAKHYDAQRTTASA